MAELSEKDALEAQALKPFEEHRFLTTADIPALAEVFKTKAPAKAPAAKKKNGSKP